jgi:hypothetical protein
MHYPCKFSQLKHLNLELLFVKDVDSISLASFLSIVCFIEELELHVSIIMCALLLRCLMHDLLLNYYTSFKELPYHVFCITSVIILSMPLLIQVFAYINFLSL